MVKSGNITIPLEDNRGSIRVELATPAKATVIAVATPATAYPERYSIGITSRSRSGFTINVYDKDGTTNSLVVLWMAGVEIS